ncbi:MAG: hypothetical protein WCQ82_06805 [Bacteroidaceae bacterium]|nr:hypothetical protein [Bacteroidaceae bacterium]
MNTWYKRSAFILLTGLLLSSCLDSAETTDQTYASIVSIENVNGVVQLIPDFQEIVLAPEMGVTTNRLQSEQRATVVFTMRGTVKEGEAKTVQLTDVYCNPIKVRDFCLQPDTLEEYNNSVASFQKVQLNIYTSYPAVWVAKNYLNIGVTYYSGEEGDFQVVADAVSNDTLYLKLKAKFEKEAYMRQTYMCYDLKTLNQPSADAAYQKKMDAISEALQELRKNLNNEKLYITLISGIKDKSVLPDDGELLEEPEEDPSFSSYTTIVNLNSDFGL